MRRRRIKLPRSTDDWVNEAIVTTKMGRSALIAALLDKVRKEVKR